MKSLVIEKYDSWWDIWVPRNRVMTLHAMLGKYPFIDKVDFSGTLIMLSWSPIAEDVDRERIEKLIEDYSDMCDKEQKHD